MLRSGEAASRSMRLRGAGQTRSNSTLRFQSPNPAHARQVSSRLAHAASRRLLGASPNFRNVPTVRIAGSTFNPRRRRRDLTLRDAASLLLSMRHCHSCPHAEEPRRGVSKYEVAPVGPTRLVESGFSPPSAWRPFGWLAWPDRTNPKPARIADAHPSAGAIPPCGASGMCLCNAQKTLVHGVVPRIGVEIACRRAAGSRTRLEIDRKTRTMAARVGEGEETAGDRGERGTHGAAGARRSRMRRQPAP